MVSPLLMSHHREVIIFLQYYGTPVVVVGDSGSLAGGSPTYLQRRCAGSPPPSLGLVARPGVALARHQVPQALERHAARLRHAPGAGSGAG